MKGDKSVGLKQLHVPAKIFFSNINFVVVLKHHYFRFDIYFTELGAALTTVLPVLFKYCYKYCYSDSRKL